MSEVLFMRVAKAGVGTPDRGDPVTVFEDGHTWGPVESKQRAGKDTDFYIVRMPDLSVSDAQDKISSLPAADPPPPEQLYGYTCLYIDELPADIRSELDTNGVCERPYAVIEPYWRVKPEAAARLRQKISRWPRRQ